MGWLRKRRGAQVAQDDRYTASPWKLMAQKFGDHKVAVASLFILAVLYLVAIFCEAVSPHDPWLYSADHRSAPPQKIRLFHEGRLQRPFVYPWIQSINSDTKRITYTVDTKRPAPVRFFIAGDPYKMWGIVPMRWHLFGVPGEKVMLLGADKLGRDLFSRILYGSRISLSIGFAGVLMSLFLGVLIGGISGYYGGWIDAVIQRGIEVLRSFPTIPLWLALAAAIPATVSDLTVYFSMTLIIALIGWTGLARVVRGQFLALREEDYVMSAKVAGLTEMQIIRRHMVPAFTSYLIVHVTLAIPGMILAETSLSFLRLGLRPPTLSWGVLLQDAQNLTAITMHPWLLAPAVFVIVTVLAYNFVGDGLRDAADPYRN